jgi:hypothetical protein
MPLEMKYLLTTLHLKLITWNLSNGTDIQIAAQQSRDVVSSPVHNKL